MESTQGQTFGTTLVPKWTGDTLKDKKAFNAYIRSVGMERNATPERIDAVVHLGDELLDQGTEPASLQPRVWAAYDGDDEQYLFNVSLVDEL